VNNLNSLEAIACVMAFDSRDWSEDFRLAWIYGIVFGWGDAIEEVQEKFEWSDQTIQQLVRLREDFQQRMQIEKGELEECPINKAIAEKL
jgi:hypothetical protein